MEVTIVSELRVGAGKREIRIPQGYLAVENFKAVHDQIHARAVIIEKNETVVIVSLEITSMPEQEIDDIRKLISDKLNIKKENIWICVTHSFSSPHLLPDFMLKTEENIRLKAEYRTALQSAACEAAGMAAANLQPAVMGMQTGFCDIVANRDIELPDGWWIGVNGKGMTDRTVSVIRFDNKEGSPIALITHFAMQSSVLDQSELSEGGKPVSSDVAGNACTIVEDTYGNNMAALFLIGAAGDQAPIEKAVTETFENGKRIRTDLHEQGFEICERLAGILGKKICEIADKAVCSSDGITIALKSEKVTVPAKKMEKDLHSLTPTQEFVYVPDGESETTIDALSLGDIAFIGVRPELNCVTATSIVAMSDFKMTLICTMVNGASKYMADKKSYEHFCYEAMNSPFGCGAAEIVSAKCIEMLSEWKGVEEIW